MLSNDDNHTCNFQNNSNPRDNEPCCRCDGRQTNADKIRNMTDEELADTIFESCIEYMRLDECRCPDNSSINEQKKACRKCVLEWLKSESEVR